jgi:hypothetical protein
MIKIAFCYVSIFCLLILISANAITTTVENRSVNTILVDLNEEGETQDTTNPSPLEEDTSGHDDETSKIASLYHINISEPSSQNLIFSNHFLTSFHFLEIISPPPQAI